MTLDTDTRCIHEMLTNTCAICLKKELPTTVADSDFYCGQCRSVVWRGDFYSTKWTTLNGVRRLRKVGECCADES